MTINQAIEQLIRLRDTHGDVQVVTDCEFCGRPTAPTTVVAGPPVVTLTKLTAKQK